MLFTFLFVKISLGGIIVRKNNMRTAEEKEKIVLEMINNNISFCEMSKRLNISTSVLSRWYYSYSEKNVEGLKSKTGKHNNLNSGVHLRKPKNKIEELELEIMKKDIEIARLKKGYMVKGVGQEKEFVTTFNKNT